ncbi:amino acid permease, partial [Nanoarchaeota archaeon]
AIMLVGFSFITLGALFSLIIPGLFKIGFTPGGFDNFSTFFPIGFGITTLLLTIFYISEMFFGWEDITFLAEETKDAERVIPKAITRGTMIAVAFSLVFSFILLSVIRPAVLGGSDVPLKAVAEGIGFSPILLLVLTGLIFLALIGGMASQSVSSPRLLLALARDKLFPRTFADIHPKNKTPYKAIIFMGLLTSVVVILAVGNIETLVGMLVPVELIMYSLVMLAVVVLRYKKPDHPRYYRAPLGKILPIFIVMINIALVVLWVNIQENVFWIFAGTIALIGFGIPIYLLVNAYYDPKAIRWTLDKTGYLTSFFERLVVPRWVRKRVLLLLGEVEGKNVLEFGCNVGTVTDEIAKAVGPKGKVYGTEMSLGQLKIAQKRMRKKGHGHVKLVHDVHHHKRVHPIVPKVDAIVAVGTLSNLSDIDNVLKHMHVRLPQGGKIIAVEYDKFFRILPNVEWLNTNQKIVDYFHKNGFAVKVERFQGLLWEYIFIYGIKFEKDVGIPVI